MKCTWDFFKNIANQEKHGIAFEEVEELFATGNYEIKYDPVHSSADEDRWIAKGFLSVHGIVIVVFVEVIDNELVRIISARPEKG